MRKFICLALIAFLVTGIAGCGYRITRVETSEPMRESPGRSDTSENEQTVSANPFEQDLISKSIALTNKMIANAADPSLLRGVDDESLLGVIADFAMLQNANPDMAIVLSFSDSALTEMMDSTLIERMTTLSVSERITHKGELFASIPAMLAENYYGTSFLAASNTVWEVDSFQVCEDPSFTGLAYVILVYDVSSYAATSWVSFRPLGEETMNGEARLSLRLPDMIDWYAIDELLSGKSDLYKADEFTLEELIVEMSDQEIIEEVFRRSLAGLLGVSSYRSVSCSVYTKEQLR